jgi:hypothetical protein
MAVALAVWKYFNIRVVPIQKVPPTPLDSTLLGLPFPVNIILEFESSLSLSPSSSEAGNELEV